MYQENKGIESKEVIMNCKECGKELDEYCLDCQEGMISDAIAKATKERRKKGKKGIIVFQGDPMYEAILARRDLEARTIK